MNYVHGQIQEDILCTVDIVHLKTLNWTLELKNAHRELLRINKIPLKNKVNKLHVQGSGVESIYRRYIILNNIILGHY